jgi:raffinose/stachyose/melibiose transport system substrate-binding protein
VFAAPLDLANVVIWYSRSLFAEHGLSPPTDFEGLLTLCRALRADGITPFALGNREQWPGAFFYVYLAARHGGTRLFLDAAGRKGPGFDTPAFIDAGRDLQRLVEADAFPTGFNGVEDAQARTRFVNGQAAMYLMGTWLVARVARENPDFLGDLDCFAFPAVAGGRGETSTVVGGVNAAFAVSSSCRYPDLAVELIRELTAPDAVRAWCESGRIPALRADDAALAALPGPTRAAFRLLETAAALQPYYDQYLPPRLAEMHKTTTQGLFAGTLTPEQAAARMEACARELAEAQ